MLMTRATTLIRWNVATNVLALPRPPGYLPARFVCASLSDSFLPSVEHLLCCSLWQKEGARKPGAEILKLRYRGGFCALFRSPVRVGVSFLNEKNPLGGRKGAFQWLEWFLARRLLFQLLEGKPPGQTHICWPQSRGWVQVTVACTACFGGGC